MRKFNLEESDTYLILYNKEMYLDFGNLHLY